MPAAVLFLLMGYSLQNFLDKNLTVDAASSDSGGKRCSPKVAME